MTTTYLRPAAARAIRAALIENDLSPERTDYVLAQIRHALSGSRGRHLPRHGQTITIPIPGYGIAAIAYTYAVGWRLSRLVVLPPALIDGLKIEWRVPNYARLPQRPLQGGYAELQLGRRFEVLVIDDLAPDDGVVYITPSRVDTPGTAA